jgi:hypothetical protein
MVIAWSSVIATILAACGSQGGQAMVLAPALGGGEWGSMRHCLYISLTPVP